MNDNTIDSIEWHRNQLIKLLSDEDDFGKVESELDFILEKAKKKVKVTRGGKTFWREQEVGRKPDVSDIVGHFGGPKGEGDPADETKRLADRVAEAKKSLKGDKTEAQIKKGKAMLKDLERALAEQKADPRGALKF